MTGVIYMLRSPKGKIYIGQSKNYEKRMESYRRLQCESQHLLYKELKRHGFDNFTASILGTYPVELLNEKEIDFINTYKSCYRDSSNGLNILKESYEEYCKIKHTLPTYKPTNKTRKIQQCTMWGDVIRTWHSSRVLCKVTKLSRIEIRKALKSKTGYYAGYIWRYERKRT